jgi:hypothetical protein
MCRRFSAAAAVVALLLVTGCGGGGGDVTPVVEPGAGSSCRGGAARPIPVRRVVAAFRRNGFSVYATTKSLGCEFSDKAYVVTNADYDIDPDKYQRIQNTEGTINCSLSTSSIYPGKPQLDLHAPAYSPIFHGRKADFSFANLDCVLYAGDARANEQVGRFARVVKELLRHSG